MNNLNYTLYILLSSLTQRTIESTKKKKKNSKGKILARVFLHRHFFDRTEIWYVLKGLVLQKYGSSTTREDLI